ncbi:MAG: hypothetical protein EFKGCFLK_00659 [Rhodocyclaceae bacterium]|nr:MAG: CopG family transcriptional regulator [Rhodocyclaceae bacterium]MBV6407106.1 hypothetical protein [Rhodocyclaceae bacterium]CAG0926604.1 hypothetical protein RHDC3_00101 [Rhodocyclaceae bacterium]
MGSQMHFNIYIDDQTGQKLARVAEEAGESRNAIIRRALQEWLACRGKPSWPEEVMAFEGLPDLPPFESRRDRLKPPPADPLA